MKVPGNIEEMARVLDACPFIGASIGCDKHDGSIKIAEYLYHEGYSKQKEGEWIFEFTLDGDDFYKCSVCGRQEVVNGLCKERRPLEHLPFCHCGAKMKTEV